MLNNKKKLLLFALLVSFTSLYAKQFIYKTEIPSTLKKSFEKYWEFRFKKQFSKSIKFELPYQIFQNSDKWYYNLFKSVNVPEKIQINKIKCKKNICYLYELRYYKGKPSFYKEKWLKIDGSWYHHINGILPIPIN
jgi:hypothetical protein